MDALLTDTKPCLRAVKIQIYRKSDESNLIAFCSSFHGPWATVTSPLSWALQAPTSYCALPKQLGRARAALAWERVHRGYESGTTSGTNVTQQPSVSTSGTVQNARHHALLVKVPDRLRNKITVHAQFSHLSECYFGSQMLKDAVAHTGYL